MAATFATVTLKQPSPLRSPEANLSVDGIDAALAQQFADIVSARGYLTVDVRGGAVRHDRITNEITHTIYCMVT